MKVNKTIKIDSTVENLFKYYLIIVNPISNLRNKEIEVLSQLMYQNYLISKEFKDPETDLKWNQLFSPSIKKKMEDACGMSKAVFANNLTTLRKKNIIQDNKLAKPYRVYPDDSYNVMFNIEVKKDVERKSRNIRNSR